MHKQTPEWIDLFHTCFGPKGLVALAWWLGAMHAKRIRDLQGSYPFLLVDGDTGVGQDSLIATLWRLTGQPNVQNVTPETHTKTALMVRLFNSDNLPVVLEPATHFDWDMLKPLFNNCSFSVHDGVSVSSTYESAIAIVGRADGSPAFASRVVNLKQEQVGVNTQRSTALQALGTYCENQFAVPHHRQDLVAYSLGKTGHYISALHDDMGDSLDARTALNHAQILALLDALNSLYDLPDQAHTNAHCEVWDMAWRRVQLPF
ncbi:hypothetical protein [Pseudomonas aeruginosa]|uniref:hypothetical protein n=1 Tax=Pseudomonas aeruginosa TaxID=287 RepID=UPI001F4B4FC6|nr:hypothetical protein [Pseudomonas aeruginosa]